MDQRIGIRIMHNTSWFLASEIEIEAARIPSHLMGIMLASWQPVSSIQVADQVIASFVHGYVSIYNIFMEVLQVSRDDTSCSQSVSPTSVRVRLLFDWQSNRIPIIKGI